jgi:hypothetical protein
MNNMEPEGICDVQMVNDGEASPPQSLRIRNICLFPVFTLREWCSLRSQLFYFVENKYTFFDKIESQSA